MQFVCLAILQHYSKHKILFHFSYYFRLIDQELLMILWAFFLLSYSIGAIIKVVFSCILTSAEGRKGSKIYSDIFLCHLLLHLKFYGWTTSDVNTSEIANFGAFPPLTCLLCLCQHSFYRTYLTVRPTSAPPPHLSLPNMMQRLLCMLQGHTSTMCWLITRLDA